ncbi:MAG TPA: ADOP family duplicated permease [Vicinamibacterales bacterium]|nr:ADOP family duplicated permease [Vicinamibacterales bacterium]
MAFVTESVAHGLRFFGRDRSVALPASAVLALGLGANLAIFSVAYAVLLRPLPVADQQSLVVMWERTEQQPEAVWEVSYRDFRDWESRNASFSQLAATGSINWSARLMQQDGPVVLPFAAVSGSFFDLLGARPALGRALTRTDDQRSGPGVAVLSDSVWRRQFAADPKVIGRSARIDDGGGLRTITIVGVMPAEFDYPRGAALWLPISPTLARHSAAAGVDLLEARGIGFLYVLGRLRSGVGLAQARADMNGIVGRLTGTGEPGTGRSIVVTPLADHIFGQTRPALLLLIGAAALVLFLTCANVIGLLLARLSANRRELAIQIALGAGRSHLLRQGIAEGAALVVAGLTAAILLALWCVPLLKALAPDTVPRLGDVTLRTPMLAGFAMGAGLLAALACGGLPLLIVLRRATPHLLAASDEPAGRTTTLRARNGLLIVQTALAVVLLVAATLTVRSFHAVQRVQLGFDPDGVVTLDVLAPPEKYPQGEANERFYRHAIERLRRLPGVSAVAALFLRPFEFGPIGAGVAVLLEGQSPRDRDAWGENPSLNAEAITPEYFKVMRIPILEGRAFNEQDTRESPPVAIVSRSAARRLWPGHNPIGKRLMNSAELKNGTWRTVVGVVGDVRYRGLTEVTFDLYEPYLQSEVDVSHFVVQASADASTFLGPLRDEIRAIDPHAIVDAIRPMQAVVDRQVAPWRFAALLFSLLAGLALAVAVVGVYALLAQQVVERTREIGVRIALGARHEQIVRFFAWRTSRVIGAGLLAGVAVALAVGRSMSALLFGVAPADAVTYAVVCALLVVAAAAGAYRPIRHAMAVDPIVALRLE